MQTFNIYCDESCHLENDQSTVMVLGAVWCPLEDVSLISEEIRRLKVQFDLPRSYEIKWTKVGGKAVAFYSKLIDYFFKQRNLHFRALVADKTCLDHAKYNQDHDDWYYKMYFDMLKVLFSPKSHYRIYLDIKDTLGGPKVRRLDEVLRNANYDFRREIIERTQIIRSHESEQMQLADLLIGCVLWANRPLPDDPSKAKQQLVEKLKSLSGYDLKRNTLLREQKVNIFHWPSGGCSP